MKKSVLIINMAKGFGGGEFQTEALVLGLLENYEVYFLGKTKGKLAEKLKATPQVKQLNFFQALFLLFRKKQIILNAKCGRSAHLGALLKKLTGRKLVIDRHVDFPFKKKSSQKSYQVADHLVSVSQKIAENLRPINPNLSVIYPTTSAPLCDEAFEEKYFSNKNNFTLTLAQVGGFLPVKNFSLTIQLAKIFPQIGFYLVGGGKLESQLKEEAKGLNNIFFIPFTPFVGSVFKQVDLNILPSSSEGFGSVIIEGYYHQTPVLANKVGGIPEIVHHDKTGFLIENNDVESYQQHLTDLLDNPQKLEELKQHIQQFMQEKDFSKERLVKEYIEIFERLI